MKGKVPDIVRQVEFRRRQTSMSQIELSKILDCDQGHLSNVLSGKSALSRQMSAKFSAILADWPAPASADVHLETKLIAAVRESPAFRELVQAALKIHSK